MTELVVVLLLAVAVAALVCAHPAVRRAHRLRQPRQPLVIPAVLCATPWQWWLQRQAEVCEVPVRFEAAPYPPRGPSGISRQTDGRVKAAPYRAAVADVADGFAAAERARLTPGEGEGTWYRAGYGGEPIWLPGPPNPGRPTRA